MYVHRRRTRIEIWTPAKLNLFLEVLGRRADGYHEIETLMVPIRLFDTLRMTCRRDAAITLSAAWTGPRSLGPRSLGPRSLGPRSRDGTATPLGELPAPQDNLAYRAVERLRQRSGAKTGLDIELFKRIPAAAGLGGGSSDAAAALVGANHLWQLNWSRVQLSEVAAELGSDVPFFLHGSPAICRGRGEIVEPISLPMTPHFVVLRPPVGLSTASVYGQQTGPFNACGWSGRYPLGSLHRPADIAHRLFNRLQAAAERLAPWMQQVRQQFDRLDLLGHQMSGSGSAYFGVCRNARHARRAAAVLRSRCAGFVFRAAVAASVGRHHVLSVSQI